MVLALADKLWLGENRPYEAVEFPPEGREVADSRVNHHHDPLLSGRQILEFISFGQLIVEDLAVEKQINRSSRTQ